MEKIQLLILGLLSVTVVSGDRIPGVCNPYPESNVQHPQLPDIFKVSVECSMIDKNKTVYVREVYDFNRNMGRVTQVEHTKTGDVFFDYPNNQLIIIDSKAGCFVEDLGTSDDRWMFGYNSTNGKAHIFGANGALHFGNAPEKYVHDEIIRGIRVEKWESCQYSPELDATMVVTWYFSHKTEWDSQLGARTVPVRATAVGKMHKFDTVYDFNHIYDFFDYQINVSPTSFELPVGVVCNGRKNAKPFPAIPDRVSFTGEIMDNTFGLFTYLEESYDRLFKINVYRYKRREDGQNFHLLNRMLQVNDFNTGVSYVVDTFTGKCQIVKIGTLGFFFVNKGYNQTVTMKTPAQFFADDKASYTYGGVKQARGIDCEVWVAKTAKVDGYTNMNVTVEWYFALEDQNDWNTGLQKYRIPVMFKMWVPGNPNAVYDFSVFYYDQTTSQLVHADITPCFQDTARRRFMFDIDIQNKSVVFNNLENFKYALVSAVSDFTGISQLRVTEIAVYYDTSAVHVEFDMLDKPPIQGDVVNITLENNLDSAVQLYNDAMQNGFLQFSVVVGTDVKTIKPIASSAAEVTTQQIATPDTSGFTTGALAGLGVGMLVVGGAAGAGGAFFFFR